MIVYTPIFYCAELQLAFNDKITREVADTLQFIILVMLYYMYDRDIK